VHDSRVVNLGDSFDAPQSHAIEIHFDAQLLDIVGVSPRAVGFEELPTAVLALVALSASSMSVFSRLSGVTLRTFHSSIVPIEHYFFSNAPLGQTSVSPAASLSHESAAKCFCAATSENSHKR
jgi:hypothetical protein